MDERQSKFYFFIRKFESCYIELYYTIYIYTIYIYTIYIYTIYIYCDYPAAINKFALRRLR